MIYLSEFIGTAIIVLLGNGVGYNVFSRSTNAGGKDYINVAIGWGFAVLIAAIVAVALGGQAQLNPAVTLGFWVSGGLDAGTAIAYMALQIAGAMFGQILLNLVYVNQIKELKNASLGMHSTGPSKPGTYFAPALNEFLGTLLLVATVIAIFTLTNLTGHGGASSVVYPLIVGFIVTGIGLGLGGVSGWAINPARDLGPRLVFIMMHILFKFEGSVVEVANLKYGWIPVIAPAIAGVAAGACFL